MDLPSDLAGHSACKMNHRWATTGGPHGARRTYMVVTNEDGDTHREGAAPLHQPLQRLFTAALGAVGDGRGAQGPAADVEPGHQLKVAALRRAVKQASCAVSGCDARTLHRPGHQRQVTRSGRRFRNRTGIYGKAAGVQVLQYGQVAPAGCNRHEELIGGGPHPRLLHQETQGGKIADRDSSVYHRRI
ncbi:hypothetical protein PLESTB_000324200 [Pleodorina starrii]|uniref:Uncharacterized protein n=1 Tax=Pleodorina starrii TaxID=330485 RepID=A0A9W6BDT1_9CHLO|nr:hypothetical protein PLESTB_000324200 [Pleodorina starrii]